MARSLVLANGRVWSPDGAGAGCDAIVVADGRISALTRSAGWSAVRSARRVSWPGPRRT